MWDNGILMGKLAPTYKDGIAKYITFCVTEDCNLACKYCYMTGKNYTSKMTFEIAKDAVDYILTNRETFNDGAVVWDFIGGEPFLEIELIDKISDYIKVKMYELDHPWFDNYRFSFSTNGLLYNTPKVQRYIKKNANHVSVGISVDGNKVKHDLQRVKNDGSGSYDEIMPSVDLWLKQYKDASTKATFAHEDLKYLKDSIISLWDLGIKYVAANVIYEDVWGEGDELIFEDQLKQLADYVIANRLWDECSVRFFDPYVGLPVQKHMLEENFCGSGSMLAIDCNGNLYPCIRFLDFSLNNQKGLCIGNIYDGLDREKLKPFEVLTGINQSANECIDCEVGSGCSWCTGYNYDVSGSIFYRVTAICKMHKANAKANKYFWDKLEENLGKPLRLETQTVRSEDKINDDGARKKKEKLFELNSELRNKIEEEKILTIMLEDGAPEYCNYYNNKEPNNIMSEEVFLKSLQFSQDNKITPLVLGDISLLKGQVNVEDIDIIDKSESNKDADILILDSSAHEYPSDKKVVFLLETAKYAKSIEIITELLLRGNYIRLIPRGYEKWNQKELEQYEEFLSNILNIYTNSIEDGQGGELELFGKTTQVNRRYKCGAGESTFTVAPNGKIYMCPAFYFQNKEESIGNVFTGIDIKYENILSMKNSPVCNTCENHECKPCKFINKKFTNEFIVPGEIKCKVAKIEQDIIAKII